MGARKHNALLAAILVGLGTLAATAQTVPAIVNTYRFNPNLLTQTEIDRFNKIVPAALPKERILEMYYESFVAGRMQGTCTGAATAGTNAVGTKYPSLVGSFTPEQMLPHMPIVRRFKSDGTLDALVLTLRIARLPNRLACQNVVNHMADLGLVPRKAVGDYSYAFATGCWRILVHPPRGKSAPPAPNLYYPEALGALKPGVANPSTIWDTTKPAQPVYAEFWGQQTLAGGASRNTLAFRWRSFDEWVRHIWDPVWNWDAAKPNKNPGNEVCIDADTQNGIIAMPYYVQNPDFLKYAEQNNGFDRTVLASDASFTGVAGTQFFDPNAMWENRLLDPDGSVANGAADLTKTTAAADAWYNALPPALAPAYADAPENRPIEIRIHALHEPNPNGKDPSAPVASNKNVNGADLTPDHWFLRGVDTTGPTFRGAAALYDTGAPPAPITAQPGGATAAFENLTNPIDIEVNLLTGDYRLAPLPGAAVPAWPTPAPNRPAPCGVGMVELQFEYETQVMAANDTSADAIQWSDHAATPAPWYAIGNGSKGAGFYYDGPAETTRDLRGSTSAGAAKDLMRPLAAEDWQYAPKTLGVVDGRSAAAAGQLVRDPLNIEYNEKGTKYSGTAVKFNAATMAWKVRRFCGWPYNAQVALGAAQADYCGGPIVCRYVVSPLVVVPQDSQYLTVANPVLRSRPYYDTSAGKYYPQPRALPDTTGLAATAYEPNDYLERALFLIGYRPDLGVSRTADYFLPVAAGSTSSAQPVVVKTVGDWSPAGELALWTIPSTSLTPPPTAAGWVRRGVADVADVISEKLSAGAGATAVTLKDYFGYNFSTLARSTSTVTVPFPELLYVRDIPRTGQKTFAGSAWTAPAAPCRVDTKAKPADKPTTSATNGALILPLNLRLLGDGVASGSVTLTGSFKDTLDTSAVGGVDVYTAAGRAFDVASIVDRVDVIYGALGTPSNARLQYLTYDASLNPVWTNWPTTANPGSTQWAGPVSCWGVRLVNIGSGAANSLAVAQLRVASRVDVTGQSRRAPTAPNQSGDSAIKPTPIGGSAVRVSKVGNCDLNTGTAFSGVATDNAQLDLSVAVPRYQPPSKDAVERQTRADSGGNPDSYRTISAPFDDQAGATPNWDRYRSELTVYTRDAKTYVNDLFVPDALNPPAALSSGYRYASANWDAHLYHLVSRGAITFPQPYQFVRWYEEDTGQVAPSNSATWAAVPPQGGWYARLDPTPGVQHVAVEPYATCDVEFSVGYERRLSVAEKLLDLGKAIGGAVSQWVPITVTNEGNVPLRQIKFYLTSPLTPVQLAEAASPARLAQANPLPAWFPLTVPLGSAADLGVLELSNTGASLAALAPAAVGAAVGNTVSTLYLRAGVSPTRRLPVGQPMGHYTGSLKSFIDQVGPPGATLATDNSGNPFDNPAKTALSTSATLKLTLTESPLAGVADLEDNDTTRRLESSSAANTAPYDPTTSLGTYQPVPVLNYFTDPDVQDATPTVLVQQDYSQLSVDPPNAADLLSVGWSRFKAPTSSGTSNSWDIWLQQGTRPAAAANQILNNNYRGFVWPAGWAVTNPQSAAAAGERNLSPHLATVPGSGTPPTSVLVWQVDKDDPVLGRRSSALALRTVTGSTASATTVLADTVGGTTLINKQQPKAFVDNVTGLGPVVWVAWQSGDKGQTSLGFNALLQNAGNWGDAIVQTTPTAGQVVGSYKLQTPPGLTAVADPALIGSYRNEETNVAQSLTDPRAGNLRLLHAFYSAWSPVSGTHSIYWTRYRPMQDPSLSATEGLPDWKTSLHNSPMAEDAYRLTTQATPGPVTLSGLAAAPYTLTSAPGGRVPFPRIATEALSASPEHTVYGSLHPDWLMPPDKPTLSYYDTTKTARVVTATAHRGFADTNQPLTDTDSTGTAVPLVQLSIYAATSLTQPAPDPQSNPTLLPLTFDLTKASWDAAAGEWVLPLTTAGGGATLAARGVTMVRVHPGLGRVVFNRGLWLRGYTNPIYVYASYRPCTWRATQDAAADSQPAVAFDWYERLVLVWRRALENGRSQLWYRTFSLSVPVNKAPMAGNVAVVDYGTNAAPIATGQSVATTTNAGDLRDGMVNLTLSQAGHRVGVTYDYSYEDATTGAPSTGTTTDMTYVPGLGPERLVPTDGASSESQPALAPEFFLAGYRLGLSGNNPTMRSILSHRFWLAWISTRDLYRPGLQTGTTAVAPVKGSASTHVFYGTFVPDFAPPAESH